MVQKEQILMTLNQVQFSKVAETAKSKTNDKRWINAIDRAVDGLHGGQWIITELFDGIMVTTESGKTYRANGKCECEAYLNGMPCKHLALRRLLDLYHEAEKESVTIKVTEGPSRSDIIADIKSTWGTKFPGLSLADELMARFRRNSLEMLSIDFLVAIKAVIN
jgi:hypothetical protein